MLVRCRDALVVVAASALGVLGFATPAGALAVGPVSVPVPAPPPIAVDPPPVGLGPVAVDPVVTVSPTGGAQVSVGTQIPRTSDPTVSVGVGRNVPSSIPRSRISPIN